MLWSTNVVFCLFFSRTGMRHRPNGVSLYNLLMKIICGVQVAQWFKSKRSCINGHGFDLTGLAMWLAVACMRIGKNPTHSNWWTNKSWNLAYNTLAVASAIHTMQTQRTVCWDRFLHHRCGEWWGFNSLSGTAMGKYIKVSGFDPVVLRQGHLLRICETTIC